MVAGLVTKLMLTGHRSLPPVRRNSRCSRHRYPELVWILTVKPISLPLASTLTTVERVLDVEGLRGRIE